MKVRVESAAIGRIAKNYHRIPPRQRQHHPCAYSLSYPVTAVTVARTAYRLQIVPISSTEYRQYSVTRNICDSSQYKGTTTVHSTCTSSQHLCLCACTRRCRRVSLRAWRRCRIRCKAEEASGSCIGRRCHASTRPHHARRPMRPQLAATPAHACVCTSSRLQSAITPLRMLSAIDASAACALCARSW